MGPGLQGGAVFQGGRARLWVLVDARPVQQPGAGTRVAVPQSRRQTAYAHVHSTMPTYAHVRAGMAAKAGRSVEINEILGGVRDTLRSQRKLVRARRGARQWGLCVGLRA